MDRYSAIGVDRRAVVGTLALAAALLVAFSLAGQLMKHFTGFEKLVWFFNVDAESNLASWFSSSLLFIAAAILGLIAHLKKAGADARAFQWAALACLFLFFSIDETSVLHERLGKPTVALLGYQPDGYFRFAWVIPAIGLAILIALYFLNFFLYLPSRTRRLVLFAAVLYVGGALGVELVGANQYAQHGNTLFYSLIATLEESMEMAGVIVFIHALLGYLEDHYGELRFSMVAPARAQQVEPSLDASRIIDFPQREKQTPAV